MLTKVQKDAIRGMLADKQSVKTIAEEQGVSVEAVSYTHLTLPTICSV